MKKVFILLMAAASVVACNTEDKKVADAPVISPDQNNEPSKDNNNVTSIQWLDSTYLDLGKVKQGAVVEVTFRFKNTGNKQLVIEDVKAGCGCTIPEKPEKPFAPGEEGVIKAKFDSKGQPTKEHRKYVTVKSNTAPENTTLNFRVEVTE